MCDDSISKEIATLLHLPSSPLDTMAPVSIHHRMEDNAWPEMKALHQQNENTRAVRRMENMVWREWFAGSQSPPSPESSTENNLGTITVTGSDVQTEYEIYEPRRHEMAVIGTYVDPRITPGFFYKIRINGTEKYQFKGKAMRLLSIGKGYGKRFTFASKSLNKNKNFFWSDTHGQGYAFSICAVFENDEFGIYDADHRHIGHATVEYVSDVQKEISHVSKERCIEKTVNVTMQCNVQIKSGPRGLLSLTNTRTLNLDGKALVVKTAKSDKSVTKYIEDVEIRGIGKCTLRSDD